MLASRPWTAPQRQWLERIGKQLEQEVVVDREAMDSGPFKAMGGYQRLNRIFQGQLDDILHDLDSLDQSILAKAFRGELVPQDPNDEPASVLLARIRQQKTHQAEATKRRQRTSMTQWRNRAGKESPRPTPQQLTLAEVLSTQD
jgi:hypothetical protein